MKKTQIIECVPNFSEGVNQDVINQIAAQVSTVEGVKLLDVDPGKATNRTVVTMVGEPSAVIEAAFRCIKKAAELIDMSKHKGEHPRMGATDVCPLIPISGITMEETAEYAHKLAKRVGEELDIPVYMYEAAATGPERSNLSVIRAGEYEGFAEKIKLPEWKPDYGPAKLNVRAGATVIGARKILVAYNVNLNTTSERRANSVAFDVREQGRIKRENDDPAGAIIKDETGEPLRIPGKCKAVKGIGWYIPEYGLAQVSMNLTDTDVTPMHIAFEACVDSAYQRGMRVTGSEVVGMLPKKALIDAGKYFLEKQERSTGISEEEIIHIAVKSMGLDELGPFDPKKKIIEYCMQDEGANPLIGMTLTKFAEETASESVAPGGGSVSAYVGALGISLGTMVANLSAHKRGWDARWHEFSMWADRGQDIKDRLLALVDEDTRSFNAIITAMRMPKSNDTEKKIRSAAIQEATKYAIQVPFAVMKTSMEAYGVIEEMVREGNPSSVTDGAVGALCVNTAVQGAWMNALVNMSGLKDEEFKKNILEEGKKMAEKSTELSKEIANIVLQKL